MPGGDPVLDMVAPDTTVEFAESPLGAAANYYYGDAGKHYYGDAGKHVYYDDHEHYGDGKHYYGDAGKQPPTLPPKVWKPAISPNKGVGATNSPVWKPAISPNKGVHNLPDPKTAPLKELRSEYSHEEGKGVKYIRDIHVLRRKYEVTLGATMRRRLDAFDTARIKALYFQKLGAPHGADLLTDAEKAAPVKVKDRANVGTAILSYDMDRTQYWWKRSLIRVYALESGQTKPAFYSHIGKIARFHHSSFKAGQGVIGAGEWVVEKGKLRKISANSGHYRPTLDYLHRAVLYMAEAWRPDAVVLLWNYKDAKWEEVPVLMFKNNPSGNGKYKTHPMS